MAANVFGARDFTLDKSQDGSATVEPGQCLRFRHRAVIHSGDARAAHVADLYKHMTASAASHLAPAPDPPDPWYYATLFP